MKNYVSMFKSFFQLFVLAIFCSHSQVGAQVGTWTALANLAPHYNSGEMELMTDGTVLCKTSAGGSGNGTIWDKLTPDIHGSYLNGTWTSITPMHYDRLYFSTQVLVDGRLYVAGGEYGVGGTYSEVYNPVTNLWTMCPQVVVLSGSKISDANSELLPDGTVLQSIVDTGVNCIYYPATNTYSWTPTCIRWDNEAPWVKLPDNSIVFEDDYSTHSERYIPATHTWINDGTLPGSSIFDPYGDEAGAAFLLPNGKAWFIGSSPLSAYYAPSGSVAPGTWTDGPAIPNNQGAPDACAAMMTNGHILLCLSPTPASDDHFPDSTTFYEFDYTTNTYTMLAAPGSVSDTLEIPTYYTNMLCLPDGTILYAAQGDDQYYEYAPGSAPLAAGQPTINTIYRTGCDTFKITGTLFNGITEGAAYGDDWQMETNYPIIQLSTGTDVYYARSFGWNRPGAVMTGAALDTASFALPVGLAYGSYTVKVIVNGNPSAPATINTTPPAIQPGGAVGCTGAPMDLTDSLSYGIWHSTVLSVATVGSLTGIVTGVTTGTSIISYVVGSCALSEVVPVNLSPAGITPPGPTQLCIGASTTLNDATPLGTWSSTAIGVAPISTGGTVSGVAVGTSVISYTIGDGCYAADTVTVNPVPLGIAGSLGVCVGYSTTLSDPTFGGTWYSESTGIAAIGSTSGMVTGAASGTSIISYVLSTGCMSTATMAVNSVPTGVLGTLAVCEGASATLNDGVPGGTWESNNPAAATIGSGSGIATGVLMGTTIITYTVAGGCYTTATLVVNHTPGSITGTANVCTTASTTLSDPDFGGTWTSTSSAVSVGTGTGSVTGLTAGSATISYTISDGCSATTPFMVYGTPSAITGPSSVCDGSTIPLGDLLTGGTWFSTITSVATVSGSGMVSGVSIGTTMITYTTAGSCYTTDVITVNTAAAPITGGSAICAGYSITLNDVTPGGSWSSSNTGVASIGSATGSMDGLTAGTTIITYNLGTACIATADIAVNPIPSAISGTTSFCSSGSSLLSDLIDGGIWSSSNVTFATVGSTSGLVSGVAAGSATITYTMGVACFVTAPVTLLTSPTAIITPGAVCLSGTASLSDGVIGGTWTSSNTSIVTIGSSSGTATGVAVGTSIISYKLNTGCNTSVILPVTPPTAAAITGSASVCIGQATTFSDATSGGSWTSSNTSIAVAGSSTGMITGVYSGTATITYTVITACGGATARKVITVNSLPSVGAIGSEVGTVCVGASITFTDGTASGVWSSGNTGIATVGSLTGVITGIGAGITQISYSVTNLAGCTAFTDQNVTVTDPLAAVITAVGSTSFCTGGYVMLDATSGTGLAYQWMLGGVNIAGATNASYTTGTNGNYTVSVNSGSGCVSVSSPVSVTVSSAPIVVPIDRISAVPGNVLCLATAPVTFTASSVYGGTTPVYQWYVNGVATITGSTYTYTPANGDVVKCLLTSDNMCAFPDTAVTSTTMTISPMENPAVSIGANPGTTVCTGEAITLSAVPVYGGPAPTYLWTKNGINVATGPSYIYVPANGDIVKCTMTSDFACLNTSTATSAPVTVSVNPPVVNTVNITVSQSIIGAGAVDTFTATATDPGASPLYQWYINGSPVTGATSSQFITSTLVNGEVVTCEIASSDPCSNPHEAVSGGITIQVGATGVYTVNTNGGFRLEPNPNKGSFTISGSVNNPADDHINITITDMLGQSVYQESVQAQNGMIHQYIELSNSIANGMYLVSIASGTDHVVFHVVVNR